MTSTTVGELVERLLSREHRGRFTLGGGTLSADGKGASWGGKKIMGLRNPDGPVAAELISSLQKEIDTLKGVLADMGWDCVSDTALSNTGGPHPLAEMVRLDEEMGLYDTDEKVPPAPNTGGHNG